MAHLGRLREHPRPEPLQRAGRERAGSDHRHSARTRRSCASSSTSRRATPGTTRMLLGLERRSGRGPAVRPVLHAVEADARRRGLRVHAAEQLRPRRREGAGEQRSPPPVRGEHRLRAAVEDADRPLRAGALGAAVQRHDRHRQQPRHDTINDRPDLANPDGDPLLASTYNANFTGRVGNLPRNFARGPGYFEAHLRVSKMLTFSAREARSRRAVRRGAQRHQPRQPEHAAGEPPVGDVRPVDGRSTATRARAGSSSASASTSNSSVRASQRNRMHAITLDAGIAPPITKSARRHFSTGLRYNRTSASDPVRAHMRKLAVLGADAVAVDVSPAHAQLAAPKRPAWRWATCTERGRRRRAEEALGRALRRDACCRTAPTG